LGFEAYKANIYINYSELGCGGGMVDNNQSEEHEGKDIYDEEELEWLTESEAISPGEAWFMLGWQRAR